MIALALAAAPSVACVCEPVYIVSLPHDGAVDVPRNAVIRLAGPALFVSEGVQFEVWADGVYRPDVEQSTRSFGPYRVWEARAPEPYPAGALVELIDRANDRQAWLSFRVGEEVDDEPPAWNGAYNVRSVVDEPPQCGGRYRHTFSWLGLSDDGWDTDSLLVSLEPLDEEHTAYGGFGDALVLEDWTCMPVDATLPFDFHRRYRVVVEDGSGNATPAFEVDTRVRTGCGCSGGRGGTTGTWLPLAALVGVRWRRRTVTVPTGSS